jgi:hypothetical protein
MLVLLAGCRSADRINIGGPKEVMGDSIVATARGAWELETGDAPSSRLALSLFCDHRSKTCTESTARIGTGPRGRFLFADGTFWTVDRWDAAGLEASMDAPCVRWTLLVDFATQQAKKSLTAKSITGMCAEFASWKPSSFTLVDGREED